MKTILETDRLLLREFVMDDVKEFFRMVSDPDVTRFTGDDCQTLEEARKRLEDGPFQDYRNMVMAAGQPCTNRPARSSVLPDSSYMVLGIGGSRTRVMKCV